MSAPKTDVAATPEAAAVAVPTAAEEEAKKKWQNKALLGLYLNTVQAVVQHVMVLQAEQSLFLKAHGGDIKSTAVSLSTCTSLVSILGVFFNQIGGGLSDAIGRTPLFKVGPLINFFVGLAVFFRSESRAMLMVTRILKMMGTTFSGSVMMSATLGEVVTGMELAKVGTKMQSYVGMAIVAGPFLESLIMKLSNGIHRYVYLGLSAAGVVQMLVGKILIAETLPVESRKPFNFSAILQALNPLGALNIYRAKNKSLIKLMNIWTLHMILEGKNFSDMTQIWVREHVQWSFAMIRNFLAAFGGVGAISGMYLVPYCMMNLGMKAFTSLASIGMAIGFAVPGFSESGTAFMASLPPQLLGINGASAGALMPVIRRLGDKEGFGAGAFAAWRNNIRAIPAALVPLLVGNLYAWLKKNDPKHCGMVYPISGFFGAVLPTLMLWFNVTNDELVAAMAP